MYNAESVIERIDCAIKAKGTTKAQMCRDIGINRNTINSMTDKKGISSFDLARIADYLGVSVDLLLGRGKKEITYTVLVSASDKREDRLRELLKKLDDDSLIMLRDYTRFLLWKQEHPDDYDPADIGIVDPDFQEVL